MLILDKLEVQHGNYRLTADLTLKKNAVCAIIGPSGAGKSTLLSAISGFIKPTSGRISHDDHDITHLAPSKRPVSILFQDNNLFPHLTIEQNIGLALCAKLKLKGKDKQRISDMLNLVGLSGFENRKPAQLSGGQQSRAAIARILLQDRPLVLLDEPFGALGPALKDEMLDLCVDMFRKTQKTVIMVTHDPIDAKRISDCVIGIKDGKTSDVLPTGAFFKEPPMGLSRYLGS